MEKLGGERYSVQEPIINYVGESSAEYIAAGGEKIHLKLGWEYVPPKIAEEMRGGTAGFVFRDVFIGQMKKLNPFVDDLIANDLIRKIEIIPPTIEGNLTVWEYLKGLRGVFVPGEKRERNVKFIDTENIENNIFQITDEFPFTNGSKTIRFDLVFLINGVPVIFVETKSADKIEGLTEALEQVSRYHRDCPEILAVLQAYAITHLIKYFYSPTWNTSLKGLFNWKEEVAGDFERLVKTFFERERIVKLITDFVLFVRQDDELKKVILRPHQMRAVEKVVKRAELEEKRRGLIWHTQGSGKTYTMIVSAKKLIENPLFENPTVIMLVDRTELESQLFSNLRAVGFESVEVAESREHLRGLLEQDKRGLIISMIHKFEGMPVNINTRKNIFVLVDEAHRTTGGKLGNYLMGALPEATYIGFTGTPIDRTSQGQGTFVIFGRDDPPKGYLDRYSIAESIEDGTTLPLYYTLASNELLVDRETLETEFLMIKEAEGVSDIEELNKVLEKAVNLRNMLKSKNRIKKVAEYVAKHFTETVEPMGYKAFLVAVDREACALYKEELDKFLPSEYSKVVISSFYNDPTELAKYHLTKEEEKRVRKAFRQPDQLPKILIVTEKLLTGFDAPILYCMYLDKPMRDHVLLQAIARVNRPYEDKNSVKKPSGFILDFVGIFQNLEKALSFDSEDIEGVVKDVEMLKEEFVEKMRIARAEYLSIIEGKARDKAVETVLEHFRNEEKRHEFYRFFKELQDRYEIISPDPFLRSYIEEFDTLAKMYGILRSNYEPGVSIDRNFMRKTAKLVQEYTSSSSIKPALEIYEINEETLKKIEESKVSDTEKVFNLLNSITKMVEEQSQKSPYLISIGEKAHEIAKRYREGQITTQEALAEVIQLTKETIKAKMEEIEKNMPADVFTVYWILDSEGYEKAEDVANRIKEVFEESPHWKESEEQAITVRKKFYEIILQSGVSDYQKAVEIVERIFRTLKENPNDVNSRCI
ncbi:MAG TPA: HsdR family type I site-specific deoxyribonuclease [Candidatus Hydrogenedens sp.]|nr:HsdR family type I site-specific deoxyribonuclease [Candidatus Hydrogenedens sp.]